MFFVTNELCFEKKMCDCHLVISNIPAMFANSCHSILEFTNIKCVWISQPLAQTIAKSYRNHRSYYH